MVRCFIGSNYERYSLNLTNILKKFVCEENIVTVPDFNDFISNYEAQDERVILFADRYYFGFHVENQLFKIFSVNPKTEIVIFDEMEFEKQFAFRLYNTGIRGLLDHVITGNDTEKRMQKVLGGQRVFPDNIAAFIANGEHLDKKDCYNAPTVKEFQFLCLVSYGFGYKQICGRFDISETMLGTYIERIRNRLGAKTTTEAVRIMLQTKGNSHLEDDEYDSFCGWDLQQGVLVEYERAGEAAKRKSPKRRTGAQCRHLQERADGMYSKKRKGQALHNDEYRRP